VTGDSVNDFGRRCLPSPTLILHFAPVRRREPSRRAGLRHAHGDEPSHRPLRRGRRLRASSSGCASRRTSGQNQTEESGGSSAISRVLRLAEGSKRLILSTSLPKRHRRGQLFAHCRHPLEKRPAQPKMPFPRARALRHTGSHRRDHLGAP
jgi:hypothetical protein